MTPQIIPTLAFTLTVIGPGSSQAETLDVTTTSANLALGTATAQVFVTNEGPSAVYVVLGVGSGTVATPSSPNLINPGDTAIYGMQPNTYIAAITEAGTTTLSVATGYLTPVLTS